LATAAIVLAIVASARRRVRQAMRLQLAEQQKRLAEEANAAKTDFMATLGHEIRTPMTGVLGMAELMARTPLDETQRAYVEAVRRSGTTLLRLVNDALDITRIESRRLVLESECVSLRTICAEVIALAAGSAKEKGLDLSSSVDAGVPAAIRGDTIRLRQILQNLVNNAVKFTERGGVSLHVGRDGATLAMTVNDTGPGMSAELCARVFSRFEQGGSPQRAQGSGLGLAICHELCGLMGGAIRVSSEPGRGSAFAVRLPLDICTCDGHASATVQATANGSAKRLLLVEDDPVVSEVIGGLLRQRGHVVTALADGLSAITALSRGSFDAMLLDLDLPVVDGFQVARLVRRMEHLDGLPIVAVTARSTGDELAAIRDAGMDALLRKPMSGDDLDAVLESVCQAPSGTLQ
jgi:nitrogen-specific signal transduction histidine kinase/ActR/RegA family two-component response regulator